MKRWWDCNRDASAGAIPEVRNVYVLSAVEDS